MLLDRLEVGKSARTPTSRKSIHVRALRRYPRGALMWHRCVFIPLSLSLYIYIYIYIYTRVGMGTYKWLARLYVLTGLMLDLT